MAIKVKKISTIYDVMVPEESVEYSDIYYDSADAFDYIRKDILKRVERFQSLGGSIETDMDSYVSWSVDPNGDDSGLVEYKIVDARD